MEIMQVYCFCFNVCPLTAAAIGGYLLQHLSLWCSNGDFPASLNPSMSVNFLSGSVYLLPYLCIYIGMNLRILFCLGYFLLIVQVASTLATGNSFRLASVPLQYAPVMFLRLPNLFIKVDVLWIATTLKDWFSTQGNCALPTPTPRDIWQSLETFLVVTTAKHPWYMVQLSTSKNFSNTKCQQFSG